MSTRRARIKAVTSLPPRRKNTEKAESKNKVPTSKDVSSINSRTPTQSASTSKEGAISSFAKNTLESQTTCNKTPSKETNTLENYPVINNTTPLETTQIVNTSTLLHTDKVQPINLIKNLSVFASPLRRSSPKKTFISPTVPSPKVLKNVDQKLHHSHVNRKTPIAQKINETNELQITGNIVNITHTNLSNQIAREEYILPCNINDEAMDGIVPLQSTTTAPKPIEILKSEIISENAEVLFDPIIPLPSPSKVRPKLRPAPRLGPHRRNSVQGSASESEDESRRSLLSTGGSTPAPRQRHDSQISHSTFMSLPNRDVSRVRNDSVCSGVSLITKQAPASPVKEKHTKRSRNDRRMNAMRRRENVKRDALTMYDLIFYNPTSNPIIPDEEEMNAKEANEKDAIERAKKAETKEPEPPKENAAPVPQIKLGPKGEIIIDEESLVIKQTDSDRKVSSVVHEGSWATGGYRAKHCRSRDWTPAETVRFYRALAVIGTDFSLMAPLFPDRTRRELKFKFKKEEKSNGAQVDKALRSTIEWDVLRLKEEFKEERALAAKQAEKERQLLLEEKRIERDRLKSARETRVRSSRGSKALSSNTLPGANKIQPDIFSVDGIIERAAKRPHRKKTKQTPDTYNVNQNIPKDLSLVNAYEADFATLTRLPQASQIKPPEIISTLPPIPSNIETGSLVVLTVNDPSSPAKKMLQTYIARGPGQLTPVALPTTFLNSVVGYMKKNNKGPGSPHIMSPSSVTSQDSRTSGTGISMLPSPAKRQRHSSFTITQL